MKELIEIIKLRAYIFMCSYRTVWDNYLDEDEKSGFDFEDINFYIKNHA